LDAEIRQSQGLIAADINTEESAHSPTAQPEFERMVPLFEISSKVRKYKQAFDLEITVSNKK
jgi:hypothetical protein